MTMQICSRAEYGEGGLSCHSSSSRTSICGMQGTTLGKLRHGFVEADSEEHKTHRRLLEGYRCSGGGSSSYS